MIPVLDINSRHGVSWYSVCLKTEKSTYRRLTQQIMEKVKLLSMPSARIHPQTSRPPPCYPFSELKFNGTLKQTFLHTTHWRMNCSYKTLPSRMCILWDQAQDTRKSERKILKSTHKYSRQRKLEMKKQGNYPSGIWVTVAILDVITIRFLNGFCENIAQHILLSIISFRVNIVIPSL